MNRNLTIITLLLLAIGCANDVVEPPAGCEVLMPTYTNGIKSIIDQTCAYSGCHDGAGGIGPGDYTSYSGLIPDLQNASIIERVISQADNPIRGMPPNNSIYPESQQDDLSEVQMEVFRCWLQNGFPE